MTDKLITIEAVCKVGKYLETPRNVILSLASWLQTPLSQLILGLDIWLQVFHHSLNSGSG